jgi:hypothetical protein
VSSPLVSTKRATHSSRRPSPSGGGGSARNKCVGMPTYVVVTRWRRASGIFPRMSSVRNSLTQKT